MSLLQKLVDQLRRQPAAYAVAGLGAVAALIVAFGHLTVAEAATLSGAATAIGTIVTAAYARPVNFTVIAGSVTVLLQSLVLLNVHMSPAEIAAVVTALNFALGIIAVPTVATPTLVIRKRQAAAAARLAAAAQPVIDVDVLAGKIAARLNAPGRM